LPEGTALQGRFVRASFGPYDTPQLENGSYPWGIEQQTGFTQLYRIDHVLVQDGTTLPTERFATWVARRV
jgi:hypothetical protein